MKRATNGTDSSYPTTFSGRFKLISIRHTHDLKLILRNQIQIADRNILLTVIQDEQLITTLRRNLFLELHIQTK